MHELMRVSHSGPFKDQFAYKMSLLDCAKEIDPKRFWALAKTSGNGCWPWRGSADRNGYGMFKLGAGRRVTASRFAYIMTHRVDLDSAEHVCHSCDNPGCVNPAHLFLGDAKINAEDKVKKGRARGRFSTRGQLGGHNPCPQEAENDTQTSG